MNSWAYLILQFQSTTHKPLAKPCTCNLILATSTHAEWILRHHRRKRTQTWNKGLTSAIFYPQQAGKTQIIGHIQRVNLSTTFHYLEYTCIFVHFTKVKLSYICTQKLNGWQVFVNIYCNTFVESTLPSRYRTLIDWLIDWLIDCLVDCMMLRVVEHKCAKLFCIVFFMWKAWYGNKKRFRNPCLMTLRNTDADIKDSRIMNFSLKFTFLLQQAYIHNPFFLNHKEFIKRKILNNLNRSFMFKTLYFSDVRYP